MGCTFHNTRFNTLKCLDTTLLLCFGSTRRFKASLLILAHSINPIQVCLNTLLWVCEEKLGDSKRRLEYFDQYHSIGPKWRFSCSRTTTPLGLHLTVQLYLLVTFFFKPHYIALLGTEVIGVIGMWKLAIRRGCGTLTWLGCLQIAYRCLYQKFWNSKSVYDILAKLWTSKARFCVNPFSIRSVKYFTTCKNFSLEKVLKYQLPYMKKSWTIYRMYDSD